MRFEDPIAAYRKFAATGELMTPVGYGAQASEPLAREEEEDIAFAKQVQAGIEQGLPAVQQQPLLELIEKGEIMLMLEA